MRLQIRVDLCSSEASLWFFSSDKGPQGGRRGMAGRIAAEEPPFQGTQTVGEFGGNEAPPTVTAQPTAFLMETPGQKPR